MNRLRERDHDHNIEEANSPQRRSKRETAVSTLKAMWVVAVTAMLLFHTVGWSVALTEYNEWRPQISSSFADFRSAINRTEDLLPVLERVDWPALEKTADELVSVSARVNNVLNHVDYLIETLDGLRRKYPEYFPPTSMPTSTTSTLLPATQDLRKQQSAVIK